MSTFDKIINRDNMYEAYRKTLKGQEKYHQQAIEFSNNETANMNALIKSLEDETYQFDDYVRFTIYEPKERIIDAPTFKDKVVQLAVNEVLKEVYYPTFIKTSYACLEGRGTHRCVDEIQNQIRKAKWMYGKEATIVKMDVERFFYSIDREILKAMLPKKIECPKTLRLLYKIIDSANQIDEVGLPLGNTLSQIFANIYMNSVDQYVKRKLSVKFYVRYMDDSIAILQNREDAKKVLGLIRSYIKQELNLKLNENKSKIFPIDQGVNMVGFKIYTTHRLLRSDSKKRIKRKVKAMPGLIQEGKMTTSKAEQILNSWHGHAMHGSSYNFIQSVLEKNSFVSMSQDRILKIDKNEVMKWS